MCNGRAIWANKKPEKVTVAASVRKKYHGMELSFVRWIYSAETKMKSDREDFFFFSLSVAWSGSHLQVLSLSSSWRSLQNSSVCLQEQRQVCGSCKNKCFLLSEHGLQTLDQDKTDRKKEQKERERWGSSRVLNYHTRQTVTLPQVIRSQFHLPSFCIACDGLASIAHRAKTHAVKWTVTPPEPFLSHWTTLTCLPVC